uniref:Uncharacterized protein n=1 Tax=Pararge aegeria TaxID=116150 RepID=S4PSY7_9NEOP
MKGRLDFTPTVRRHMPIASLTLTVPSKINIDIKPCERWHKRKQIKYIYFYCFIITCMPYLLTCNHTNKDLNLKLNLNLIN